MKQRKEVHLEKEVIKELQKLADADYRELKPYMEKVLIDHSKEALKNNKLAEKNQNKQ